MSSVFNSQNIERMRVNGNEIALAKINGNVVFQKKKLIKTFYGDSKQNVTQGYNELEPKMETSTRLGVTCTNNGDGTFTLNGTAQYNTDFRINQSTVLGLDNLMSLNGEYTLKSENKLIEGVNINITQNETWKSPLKIDSLSNKSSYNFENFNDCFVTVYIYQGTVLNNFTIKPFLYKGTDDKLFEPYTGGQASPNPDYPQKISSINGVNLKISNGSKELKIPINLQGNILAKVGDYADELQVYLNGDVKIVKKIGKTILNNTANYAKSTYSTDEYFRGYLNGEETLNFAEYKKVMNTHFQSGEYNQTSQGEMLANRRQLHIQILASRLSENSVTGLQEWLGNNNVTALRPLANSITRKVDNIKEELNSFGDYSNIEIETTYS